MSFILRRPPWYLPDSAATPESKYVNRRQFLRAMGATGIIAAGIGCGTRLGDVALAVTGSLPAHETNPDYADAGRPLSDEKLVTTYNNFYEFGFGKDDPVKNAQNFKLDPYTLTIDGLVDTPLTLDLDTIYGLGLEERVYRFRCVEAWAMTVPWVGVPLRALLDRAGVKADAKYITFQSFLDPEQAPGQKNQSFDWPYHEALRIDEAMNDLTFISVGLYGKKLPPQSGTPLRVIVPWKYGYKGPKSVVRMELVANQPKTFWNEANAREYKFYSNVDPQVPHPRWSQAKERYIEEVVKSRPTRWYNGYEEQVAHMYSDMPRVLY